MAKMDNNTYKNTYSTVHYRSKEFYEIRQKLINSLPKVKMTPKTLAKLLIEGSVGPIQVDTYMDILFPDFNKFFASEQEGTALSFVKQYLPECELNVEVGSSKVKVLRMERIPSVGLYPNVIGYAQIKNNLPASILAAGLFAYDYLSS